MKKLVVLLTMFTFLLTACEGDPGPPGQDGLNGSIIASSAFEIVIDFNPTNNYEYIEAYGFEVLPTDVTLVYILWETLDGQDIWRLIPQTVEFDDGNLLYNYDFTQVDVRFFLEGSTDFSTLDSAYTDNQIFRVIVVPADNVGRYDYSNIDKVMETFNITEFEMR